MLDGNNKFVTSLSNCHKLWVRLLISKYDFRTVLCKILHLSHKNVML